MIDKVMVVDDTGIDLLMTTQILKKANFAEDIIAFESVAEALNYFKTHKNDVGRLPDVLFLDINMPGMDGFDFLDQFVRFPGIIKKHCAIIMASSTIAGKDLKRLNDYPIITKFFPKPLTLQNIEELKQIIAVRNSER
jgi:CheY-like chemotaxis protein